MRTITTLIHWLVTLILAFSQVVLVQQALGNSDCKLEGSIAEICDTGYSIAIDNEVLAADSLTHVNEDRDYTMGLAVAFHGYRVTSWPLFNFINNSLNKAEETFEGKESEIPTLVLHSAIIGDTAFTPDDLASSEPVEGDRPYANLLFMALEETEVFSEKQSATKDLISIGILGLDIGKAVQRQIHCDWGAAECPQGWSNQISDGGELTVLWRHTWLWNLHSSDSNWGAPEFTPYSELDIGYYTDAAAGFSIRWGRLFTKEPLNNPIDCSNFSVSVPTEPKIVATTCFFDSFFA